MVRRPILTSCFQEKEKKGRQQFIDFSKQDVRMGRTIPTLKYVFLFWPLQRHHVFIKMIGNRLHTIVNQRDIYIYMNIYRLPQKQPRRTLRVTRTESIILPRSAVKTHICLRNRTKRQKRSRLARAALKANFANFTMLLSAIGS